MVRLIGCDFSSSPTARKNIVLAVGALHGGCVQLSHMERLASLDAFSVWLAQPGPWVGGFDLPFGLPRGLVEALGWPLAWEACMHHYAALSRVEIRAQFAAFCAARPVGGKFAHRQTDIPAGSSPSMKWVNPPVAYMLHAGVPRLLHAGVYFPGLQALPQGFAVGPPPGEMGLLGGASALPRGECGGLKVALEAYPGMLAREILGTRSYKSDDKAKQTPERLIARKDVVTALEMGLTRLGLRLKLSHAQRDVLVDDASGDALDAVLCLMQAAWAQQQHQHGAPCYGLPLDMDPLEGWIVSA